jgi:molecular chaperone DnaK
MSKVVGIDLGTTNSCIVVMEGGTPQVIPNQEGARTTPSIVGFTSKGERLVGQIAKRQALTNPQNTVHGVKRLIGRKFHSAEVESARKVLPYEIIEAANSDAHIRIHDKVFSPPELSAIVLQKLKAAAEDYLGERVEEAIITVPAYFNDSQRQATRDAGTVAGLNVQRIINEPTAAALAYGVIERRSGKVAVYDLGGGTFDISVLELSDGLYRVLATGGDTYLGGEDIDQLIIQWLVEEFQKETGIDLTQDRMALQRLKEAAEKAKCELSTAMQAEIVLPFISANQSGPRHLNTVLHRAKFEQMIEPLLERTVKPCERALKDAGLTAGQLDEVILVGGQTRTPKVVEVVRRLFGKEPSKKVNPDEVVSIGAAIQTGILQGEVTDLVLLDVTPHTLGIETKDGTFTPLIDRNSSIPTKKSRIFTTVVDNQTKVEINVLQGESTRAAENHSLGKFELTDIAPAPAKVPQIDVTFEIDENGIVRVTARDEATGRGQNIVVRAGSGLTPTEVDRLRAEHLQHEAQEKQGRERDRLVGQLQGLRDSTKRTFDLLASRLSDRERIGASQALALSEKVLANGSVDELRQALGQLESSSAELAQVMMRDMAGGAGNDDIENLV